MLWTPDIVVNTHDFMNKSDTFSWNMLWTPMIFVVHQQPIFVEDLGARRVDAWLDVGCELHQDVGRWLGNAPTGFPWLIVVDNGE